MFVNGTDYPTPDGTCVRDYVHVDDLARAHVAGPRASGRRRRLAGRQLRLRPRLLGARGARHRPAGDGSRVPDRGGSAAPGRPGGAGGRQPPHPEPARLAAATTISITSSATAWRWEQRLRECLARQGVLSRCRRRLSPAGSTYRRGCLAVPTLSRCLDGGCAAPSAGRGAPGAPRADGREAPAGRTAPAAPTVGPAAGPPAATERGPARSDRRTLEPDQARGACWPG